jgi:hypothetical protein
VIYQILRISTPIWDILSNERSFYSVFDVNFYLCYNCSLQLKSPIWPFTGHLQSQKFMQDAQWRFYIGYIFRLPSSLLPSDGYLLRIHTYKKSNLTLHRPAKKLLILVQTVWAWNKILQLLKLFSCYK